MSCILYSVCISVFLIVDISVFVGISVFVVISVFCLSKISLGSSKQLLPYTVIYIIIIKREDFIRRHGVE